MSRASSSRGGRRGVYVEAPGADIYTALLGVALGGILIACLILFLELARYGFDASAPTSALPGGMAPAPPTAVAMTSRPESEFTMNGTGDRFSVGDALRI